MAKNHETSQRDLVKSAARSLDILEFLSAHPGGATLTDIRQSLKIPISSLHSIIMTLVQKGYVTRNEITLMYHLGPMIGQLVASYYEQVDLTQLADPYMARLAHLTHETSSLTVLRGDHIVFIHKVVGEGVLQIVNPVGTTLAAHATGSGKVMLACLPEDELDQIFPKEQLPRFTPQTITSKKELKQELLKIAECGYAFDQEESNTGIWAVAACIRDRSGRPAAALSIVGLVGRVHSKDYQSWPQYVMEITSELSAAMGYRPVRRETNR